MVRAARPLHPVPNQPRRRSSWLRKALLGAAATALAGGAVYTAYRTLQPPSPVLDPNRELTMTSLEELEGPPEGPPEAPPEGPPQGPPDGPISRVPDYTAPHLPPYPLRAPPVLTSAATSRRAPYTTARPRRTPPSTLPTWEELLRRVPAAQGLSMLNTLEAHRLGYSRDEMARLRNLLVNRYEAERRF